MNILITGGSGFLGRGIMRKARRESWDAKFVIYSRSEHRQDVCKQQYPEATYVLGDARDYLHLLHVINRYEITHVIHAAAMKYVPEAELNAMECIAVNVESATAVVRATTLADKKLECVVGISTDKAVKPVNVYGATKMLMERIFAEASANGHSSFHTTFNTARYGNVVGSTGSVIPVFKQQLERQGYVTITDPKMTRFWISIDDAVRLIEYAMSPLCTRGATVIPRPKAMSMGDLAQAIAGDEIKIVGARPGEKIDEELLSYQESGHVKRGEYYELIHPPGETKSSEPFTVASHSPSSWMTKDELLELIADAEDV